MESLPAVVQQHALDICHGVDYPLQPARQHLGAFYLLFPARIAYLVMPRQLREAQWLQWCCNGSQMPVASNWREIFSATFRSKVSRVSREAMTKTKS